MCETRRQHALSMQIEVLANPLAGFPLQRSTLDVQCSMFAFNRPKSLSSTPFIRHSETRNSSFPPGPRESTGKPVFNCQARYGRGVSPEISPGSQAEQRGIQRSPAPANRPNVAPFGTPPCSGNRFWAPPQGSPISSFQTLGFASMKRRIRSTHLSLCTTSISTPRLFSSSSSPMKVWFSPITTFGIP
jgi:hypothetical protein